MGIARLGGGAIEVERRKGRPVGGMPKTPEEQARALANKKLHAVGDKHGLSHEDLSELADCSLAIAPTEEMQRLIQMIPMWEQQAEWTGEDAVSAGLIAHLEAAKTEQEIAQSWKLYSNLFLFWNKLTQHRVCRAKKVALWRVEKADEK